MEDVKLLKDAFEVYDKRGKSYGDYSITQLIDPPRRQQLLRRYGDQIKQPISSRIDAFIGTAIHAHFERMYKLRRIIDDKYEVERKIIDKINDRLIAGIFDVLWDGKELWDIKTAKAWKLIFDPDMKDWHQQQNMYAYLLHRRGIDVESINILCYYKDWSQAQALRDRRYPQTPVCEYQLKLWPWEETESLLENRIELHKACEHLKDDDLPPCTAEETWARFDTDTYVKYAFLKNDKAKRATRVFNDRYDMVDYITKQQKTTKESRIEVRYPERTRCERFCHVNVKCNQYRQYLLAKQYEEYNKILTIEDFMEKEESI